jgi:hypothetical protein
MAKAGVLNPLAPDLKLVAEVIGLTGNSLITQIAELPAVKAAGPQAYDAIVLAGQIAYSDAYKYVYYVSIGMSPPVPLIENTTANRI